MRVRDRAGGFTLLEVLFSTSLLLAGVVAVANLSALATRASTAARTTTIGALLAADKMEQLRSLAWGFDAAGQPVADTTTDLTVSPPAAAAGVGLTPSPADSLAQNAAGYCDFLDASGRWVRAAASSAPPEAVYVRRWSIAMLPADPVDTLALQVVVLRNRRFSSGALRLLPDEVSLVTVRTRKST